MTNKELNRLKVVLAEKKCTNKWLSEQLKKDKTTISKWSEIHINLTEKPHEDYQNFLKLMLKSFCAM